VIGSFGSHARHNGIAYLALFVALGGTSYAAIKLPANSVGPKQITKGAVTSVKIKDGSIATADLAAGALKAGGVGPAGLAGPKGDTGAAGAVGSKGDPGDTGVAGPAGPAGPVGPAGSNGAASVKSFAGPASVLIGPNSGAYVFAGPTVSFTLAAGQRMTGAAVAPLGTGGLLTAVFAAGLCYQVGAGQIMNFVGGFYSVVRVPVGSQVPVSAAASTAPGAAGTYTVGYCVQNSGPSPLNNNDYVNGWVMVTDS
jgi:hypothetical protein